jgi:CBS domain-containing protein
METDPITSMPETDVAQVIREISRRRATYSLVAVWGELQGIITYRDCVRLLITPATETVPISIVGLPDDPFEGQAARTKFERVVKRLAKSLPSLLEARSVIRTSEKTGHRRRYEVEVALITPSKTTSFKSSGWSLPVIYDELTDRMKRLTTHKTKQRKPRLVERP